MKLAGLFLNRYSFVSYYLWFVHVILGFIIIVYSQIAILSGLYLYDSPITFLFYIHLGIMICTLITIEVIFQMKKTWKYSDISQLEAKDLPVMSLEEVNQSNRKLSIFDQYVIDIGGYFLDHPGGKYVLEE